MKMRALKSYAPVDNYKYFESHGKMMKRSCQFLDVLSETNAHDNTLTEEESKWKRRREKQKQQSQKYNSFDVTMVE